MPLQRRLELRVQEHGCGWDPIAFDSESLPLCIPALHFELMLMAQSNTICTSWLWL